MIEAERWDALAPGGTGLKSMDVIARAVPSQKVDVVRRLQAAGEIVAVAGDGVNDAPQAALGRFRSARSWEDLRHRRDSACRPACI